MTLKSSVYEDMAKIPKCTFFCTNMICLCNDIDMTMTNHNKRTIYFDFFRVNKHVEYKFRRSALKVYQLSTEILCYIVISR